MKLGRFLFSGLVLAGLLVYPSCRKADTLLQDQSQVKNTTDHKFFNEHRSADARENALIRFLKRKNDSLHFVQKTVEKIGYPRWDKGMVISTQALSGLTASDSSFIVYVPFVKESQNYVNASMIVRVTPADTSFSYLCDWQYKSLGFDTTTTTHWNARTAFQLFSLLDYNTFGHTQFRIKDSLLFAGDSVTVTLAPANSGTGRASLTAPVTQCTIHIITSCTTYSGRTTTSSVMPAPCTTYSYTFCTTTWPDPGGLGGGGGSGSGGGTPPDCPSGTGRSNLTDDPCGTGWEPVGDEPGGSTPTEPVDTLLKKHAVLANRFRDSIAILCESDHTERAYTTVIYNGILDTLSSRTGNSGEVKPNYYTWGGRILKGVWHYHPDYEDGTPGSWPSGGDLAQLYDKDPGFVSLIDTKTGRYALVLEDKLKLNTWKAQSGNGPVPIVTRLINLVNADSRAWSTGATYLQMTKEKLLQVLGNSSNCGIGLYEATSLNGTTFVKVN